MAENNLYHAPMAIRDIVTIGGSAGSVEIFQRIVEKLPPDLPAAIFVVPHLFPRAKSYLAEILQEAGHLPAHQVTDGEKIRHGRIYVAPPDRHVMIAEGHVHLTRGPKEGMHRPSINVTFRSAAATYGSRVIGVLVSGLLDDGAAGIWEITQRGGTTIVQNPDEAPYPSMPQNALQDAAVDYKLSASEIGDFITGLVTGTVTPGPPRKAAGFPENERFSGLTCPECRGPLYTTKRPGPIEFHCRVGHILSLESLINESTSTQERKLYEAIVALQEGADLAGFASTLTESTEAEAFRQEAEQLRRSAETIRAIIEERLMPGLP